MAVAGLAAGDAHPELAPQLVSTGVPQVIALVRDADALARVDVDDDALRALLDPLGAIILYLTAWDEPAGAARARGLTAVVEGGEDPATGSAAGPLCAYLQEHAGATRVDIAQGVEMGRPSRLVADMDGDRARVARRRGRARRRHAHALVRPGRLFDAARAGSSAGRRAPKPDSSGPPKVRRTAPTCLGGQGRRGSAPHKGALPR